MKLYKNYIFDLDGTLYRGGQMIDGVLPLLNALRDANKHIIFATNNSSRTPQGVKLHLQNLGIEAQEREIVTSALATANYIKREHFGKKVFLIGEEGLARALEGKNIETGEDGEVVVVGIDRQISYYKLAHASRLVNNGAPFIATNLDDGMPSEQGILPGNGAICKVIIATTKKEPLNIGKPSHELIDLACQTINGLKQETLIVGDNLNTDILAAHRSGMDSLLVFTGYSQKHDLLCSEIKPTYQVDDLSQWLSMLS